MCIIYNVTHNIAHGHHLYYQLKQRGVSTQRAIMQVGFQLIYTTIFGFMSAFVFLRTGHVLAAIAMHAFCNSIGFPRFSWIKLKNPKDYINCVFYVIGLVSFCVLFVPWTEPSTFKSPFYGY